MFHERFSEPKRESCLEIIFIQGVGNPENMEKFNIFISHHITWYDNTLYYTTFDMIWQCLIYDMKFSNNSKI